jgi:hypothetical protein
MAVESPGKMLSQANLGYDCALSGVHQNFNRGRVSRQLSSQADTSIPRAAT